MKDIRSYVHHTLTSLIPEDVKFRWTSTENDDVDKI